MKLSALLILLSLTVLVSRVTAQCDSLFDETFECLMTLSDSVLESCGNCLEAAADDVQSATAYSCGDVNRIICNRIDDCNIACGSCADEITKSIECNNEVINPGCDVECGPVNQGSPSGGTRSDANPGATPTTVISLILIASSVFVGYYI